MNQSSSLPSGVLSAFAPHTGAVKKVSQPPQGRNATVWQIQGERGIFIVKSGDAPDKVADVAREANILLHLSNYVPCVPQSLAQTDTHFLFSYLPGTNLARCIADAPDPDTRAALCNEHGRLLRNIHAWQPPLPHPDDWYHGTLTRAEATAQKYGLATAVDSRSQWKGQTYGDLWRELEATRTNITPRIVFCHGDWCLPNVLINNNRATGAVDWSAGGWADFRTDLATALWSLRYNLGHLDSDPHLPRYLDQFLRGYGYDDTIASLRFWEALYLLT